MKSQLIPLAAQQIRINPSKYAVVIEGRVVAMEFSKKSKWLVLLLLILSCIVFYIIGFKTGIIASVVAGVVLEACFWLGLFKIKPYWPK